MFDKKSYNKEWGMDAESLYIGGQNEIIFQLYYKFYV